MKRSYLIIIGGLIVLVVGWLILQGGATTPDTDDAGIVGVPGEPYDVVADFYTDWLAAVQATNTTPYNDGVAAATFLTSAVQDRLLAERDAAIDPVLCQEVTPERIAVKEIFIAADTAEFYVIGRGPEREKLAGQSSVRLARNDSGWFITDIACGFGETAPEREFSFEQEGFLLKDSLPESFDKSYWYLVYEQDGQGGYTVPLFFSDVTNCGTEAQPVTCDQSQLTEASKASVKGQMTEAGLDVLWFEVVIE